MKSAKDFPSKLFYFDRLDIREAKSPSFQASNNHSCNSKSRDTHEATVSEVSSKDGGLTIVSHAVMAQHFSIRLAWSLDTNLGWV